MPPASRFTFAPEMSPEPEAGQDEPDEATHVQLTPDSFVEEAVGDGGAGHVRGPAGCWSPMIACRCPEAPALTEVLPSVFVTARSELSGDRGVVGGGVVAARVGDPGRRGQWPPCSSVLVAVDLTTAETVQVAVPPARSRFTFAPEMSPEPEAGQAVPGRGDAAVQLTPDAACREAVGACGAGHVRGPAVGHHDRVGVRGAGVDRGLAVRLRDRQIGAERDRASSVAELLPLASVTPAGGAVTVAVLESAWSPTT